MKILLVSAFFDTHRGGVERVAGHMAHGLANDGMTVDWLAADASPPKPSDAFAVTPVPAWNGVQRALGVPVPLWGITAIRRMLRRVRDADAVIIHDTLYMGNILCYLAAKRFAKPILIVQHVGPIDFSNRILRAIMWLADRSVGRWMMRRADQVVFISATIRDMFAGMRYRRPPALVFNGVDTDIFGPKSQGPAAATPVVLFSGRFVERKGIAVVEALARAMPTHQFVLAGWGPVDPDDWSLPNVARRTADTSAEMAQIYRAASILILPSVGEGFPLVVQEALSTGLPVICNTETITADAVLGDHVFHADVDLSDPGGTAQIWQKVIETALATDTADKARARAGFAAERYGWSVAIARYRALLDTITDM